MSKASTRAPKWFELKSRPKPGKNRGAGGITIVIFGLVLAAGIVPLVWGEATAPGSLAGTMRLEKGSTTVAVALFGVSPNSWCGSFQSPFGAPARVLTTRRRDADGNGRDDRAPPLQ